MASLEPAYATCVHSEYPRMGVRIMEAVGAFDRQLRLSFQQLVAQVTS